MQTETEQKTIVDYLRDKVHHAAKTGRDTYVKNALDELLDEAKQSWLSQLRKEIEGLRDKRKKQFDLLLKDKNPIEVYYKIEGEKAAVLGTYVQILRLLQETK